MELGFDTEGDEEPEKKSTETEWDII